MFSHLLLGLSVVTYWCVSTLLKCFSEAEPKWTLSSGKPLQEQSSGPQTRLKCQLKISTLLQQTSFLSYFCGDRIKSVSWEISWRFISRIAGVYCFPLIDSLIQKVEKIKLLGDSSIFTRALQTWEHSARNFYFHFYL